MKECSHDYEIKGVSNNIACFKCKLCDNTELIEIDLNKAALMVQAEFLMTTPRYYTVQFPGPIISTHWPIEE